MEAETTSPTPADDTLPEDNTTDDQNESLITNVLKFECSDCDAYFMNSNDFEKHIDDYHPEQKCRYVGEVEIESENRVEDTESGRSQRVEKNCGCIDDQNAENSFVMVKKEPICENEDEVGTPCIEYEVAEDALKKEPETSDQYGSNPHHVSYDVEKVRVKSEVGYDDKDYKSNVELAAEEERLANLKVDYILKLRNSTGTGEVEDCLFVRRLKSREFVCEACGRGFCTAKFLRYHMKTHTGEYSHVCFMCGKGYSRDGELRHHIAMHPKLKNYPCNFCGKILTLKKLKKHITEKHRLQMPYFCNLCKTFFLRLDEVRSHMKTCREITEIVNKLSDKEINRKRLCLTCNKRFTAVDFVKHQSVCHEETSSNYFVCWICDKQFSVQDQFLRHVSLHNRDPFSEKQFNCTMCARHFATKAALKNHRRVHKKDKKGTKGSTLTKKLTALKNAGELDFESYCSNLQLEFCIQNGSALDSNLHGSQTLTDVINSTVDSNFAKQMGSSLKDDVQPNMSSFTATKSNPNKRKVDNNLNTASTNSSKKLKKTAGSVESITGVKEEQASDVIVIDDEEPSFKSIGTGTQDTNHSLGTILVKQKMGILRYELTKFI